MQNWRRTLLHTDDDAEWSAYADYLRERGLDEFADPIQRGRIRCYVFEMRKKSGGTRRIFAPSPRSRRILRDQLRRIYYLNYSSEFRIHEDAYGFVQGRDVIQAARTHAGYRYTLSMDLCDFFDSITESHLADLPEDLRSLVLYAGAPRQGLPTSPAISNIAARHMDAAISKLCPLEQIRYTRYADDLCFSGDFFNEIETIRNEIGKLVVQFGFRINEKKTRIQDGRYMRKIILGVSVGENDTRAPRSVRRKLRAAEHRDSNSSSCRGLRNWVNRCIIEE